MIDLSTSEKEKEYYVTGVEVSENGEEYILTYADGHKETRPFTIHNYNAEIYRMRDAFYSKKDSYLESLGRLKIKYQLKKVRIILLSLLGVVFTTSIELPLVAKIITYVLILLLTLVRLLHNRFTSTMIDIHILGITNTEEFISLMDKLKVDVVDPHNGGKEEWFLYNLNDVGPFTNVNLLGFIAAAMPEEIKKAEGERLSELFKEEYEKSLVKKPDNGMSK